MKGVLFTIAMVIASSNLFCQTELDPDSLNDNRKAKYIAGDLTDYFNKNISYNNEALRQGISGDVIISFTISRDGKMTGMQLVSSPDFLLTNSPVDMMRKLVDGWSPATVNKLAVEKRYQIVFRFRFYYNTQPVDYKGQIKRFIERDKLEKALSMCRVAIKDNEYDSELVKLRSEIKARMGDAEGSEKDNELYRKMEDEIMTVIMVNAIGIVRQERVLVGTEIRKL